MEFNEMQNQVILLSTTNANLEQQVEESHAMQENVESFLEDDLCLDLLSLCKQLNINYAKGIMTAQYPTNTDAKIDILKDLLDMEVDSTLKEQYLDTFNANIRLFALIKHLKQQKKVQCASRIIILQTFKSYYRKGIENATHLKQLKTFCEAFEESKDVIDKIQNKAKQEVIASSINIFS